MPSGPLMHFLSGVDSAGSACGVILPARSSPKHLLSRAGDASDRVEPREAGTPEAQLNYPSRPGGPGACAERQKHWCR